MEPENEDLPCERGILAFGPFKLDPMRRSLLCNGVVVPLTARLFDTLVYLVRHPERLVARGELENAIWGGRQVEEGNLQKAVSSLRKALQTDTPGERYIVTIPGKGFQFTAPVRLEPFGAIEPDVPAAGGPETKPEWAHPPRRRRHFRNVAAAVAVLLLAAAPVIWDLGARRMDDIAFLPPPGSVAVLPFINTGGDAGDDYVSDGLTDELIDTLSRVGRLRVAARTSAFSFKGSHSTIRDIARRLNVAAILEGSVRRDGQRVHIAVQLIDTRSGFQLWSRFYDSGHLSDSLLKLQTDVAETLSASLNVGLIKEDAARLTVGGTRNARAFDAYLRGMNNSRDFGEAHIRQAVMDFSEAITLDPAFAQAFAGRAAAHSLLVIYGYETDADNARQDGAAAALDAQSAIDLAPTLAEAHRVKSVILLNSLAFQDAARELAIAWDLSPNDAMVEATHGTIEARFGHSDIAMTAARHAIALDPLNPGAYQRLGQALYWTRNFSGALEAFDHAIAVDKHPSRVNMSWIASAYLAKNDPAAAARICAGGDSWTDDACLAIAYQALGRQREAEMKFAKLYKACGDHAAYIYAEIYAQWRRPADAMYWLERAYSLKDSGLDEMKVSPFLDPIREVAGFSEIERRLNFPP